MVIKLSQRNSHFRVEKVKGKGTSPWSVIFSNSVYLCILASLLLLMFWTGFVLPSCADETNENEHIVPTVGGPSGCCCQICLHNVSRAWARQTSFWWYASTHLRTTNRILIKIKTILLVFEIFSPLGWFHAMTCDKRVVTVFSFRAPPYQCREMLSRRINFVINSKRPWTHLHRLGTRTKQVSYLI